MENRPFTREIVRSIKVAVVEHLVNSQVRPMLLISVLKHFHSNSSVVGSGSVSHITKPSSMNRRREEIWRGFPDGMCLARKIHM